MLQCFAFGQEMSTVISVQNTEESGGKALWVTPGLEATGRCSLCCHVYGVVGGITWANLLLVCAAPGIGLSCKCE